MELTKEIKEFLKPDLNISKFCLEAKMSRSTFIRRMKSPKDFTMEEVKVLMEISGFTQDQIFKKEKSI